MKYEIPYEQLNVIGLPPHVVDAMPDEFKSKLMNGELTPLVNVKREINGMALEMPMKLRVEQDMFDNPRLTVYPLNTEVRNSINVGQVAFDRLVSGDVLHMNGYYYQREPETNCILKKSEREIDIDRRIEELEKVRDIELGVEQKKQMKEGKPVELDIGGEKVSVGLDLRDKDHFRTLNGDMNEWSRQKEIEYDIQHPEYVGIVQTDENRWEQQIIKREGFSSQTLKERPAQTQSSGMKL